jgi:hypothetical protein
MTLRELLAALGSEPLHPVLLVGEGVARVDEVVIQDPFSESSLQQGQVVLGVGVNPGSQDAQRLVQAAGCACVSAVVIREAGGSTLRTLSDLARTAGVTLLMVNPQTSWTQLLVLLRTLIAVTGTAAERLLPEDIHGLAGAIADMVGGSVVLYDRAHRVIAYEVQGFDIDDVRRDTILGRQTPEQWVQRFSTDGSAYRTFRYPGTVVRVDGYADLHTRLRIMIHAGEELLGEISVAADQEPLGVKAEEALEQAAHLAAPVMLRHRLLEDTERMDRWRLFRALLDGDSPIDLSAEQSGFDERGWFIVLGLVVEDRRAPESLVSDMFRERTLHLLSLHVRSIASGAGLIFSRGVYYALVPAGSEETKDRLTRMGLQVLQQLASAGGEGRIAVGPRVVGIDGIPRSRAVVDDLLQVLGRPEQPRTMATAEELWAELALLQIERAAAGMVHVPCKQLQNLIDHDAKHQTEYVNTLNAYLDAFGSVSSTAERLMLHSNSLRHRLQRLADVSGLDLSDPTQRLIVALQLRLLPAAPDG